MKPLLSAMFVTLFLLGASAAVADDYEAARTTFSNAGIGYMFEDAYGYALFPTVGEAGFIVGGAYGDGRVYEQGAYVGDSKLFQASIGFQLGGSVFSQVIFFEDQRAFTEFVSGDFQFGAEAEATLLTASAGASAGTGGTAAAASGTKDHVAIAGTGYTRGMATYTITQGGLMYEASIGGQKFTFTRR